jgi:hypothetical protein
VVVVGSGASHDVEDALGIFFPVQGDSVHYLTLLIVTDGGLYV